jgi:hypothetical protein
MKIVWRTTDCKYKEKFCQILFGQTKRYCDRPKSYLYEDYGAKGAKCFFNSALEIEKLYMRDRVYEMKDPWLARKVSDGDFSPDNCFFIESNEKIRKEFHMRLKKIIQEKLEKWNKRREMFICESAVKQIADQGKGAGNMTELQQIKYYIENSLTKLDYDSLKELETIIKTEKSTRPDELY